MVRNIIPSRVRRSFTWQSIATGLLGAGMTIISAILPCTGWQISERVARGIFFFGIALIVVALVLVVCKYWEHRNEQICDVEDIAKTLRGIHKRLTALKDLTLKQEIDKETFKQTCELILDAFGIVKLGKMSKIEDNIRNYVKNNMGKEEVDKDEIIRLITKRFNQQIKIPKSLKRNMTIQDTIDLGNILDGKGIGLARLRDKDRAYTRLNEQIHSIEDHYSDTLLNAFMQGYLISSYGINSYSLYIAYSVKFDPHETIPKTFPILIQKNWRNIKMQSDSLISDLLTKIISRVKELGKGEKQNDARQIQV